jgi:hypothetical protein
MVVGLVPNAALLIGFLAALAITRAWVLRRLRAGTFSPVQAAALVAAIWGSLPFLVEFASEPPFNVLAATISASALALGSGGTMLVIGNRIAERRDGRN